MATTTVAPETNRLKATNQFTAAPADAGAANASAVVIVIIVIVFIVTGGDISQTVGSNFQLESRNRKRVYVDVR